MAVRLMLRELFSGTSRVRKLMVEQVVGGIYERLITIFSKGQQAGLLRPGLDPELCAFLILGTDLFYFQTYELQKLSPLDKYALEKGRFSDEMMDIVLNGMLVRPEDRSPES